MDGGQEQLSHEEVWDDSALIDSWNEALAEYKKYHSIHAKGGSIRDLEPNSTTKVEQEPNTESSTSQYAKVDQDANISDTTKQGHSSDAAPTTAARLAPPPQALLGSIRDDGLKKLLMSWYYAGYYTGLFEGQQQAQQSQQPES